MANISPEAANSPIAMREAMLDQLTGAQSTGPAPQQTQDAQLNNLPAAAFFGHKMGQLYDKLAYKTEKIGSIIMEENATMQRLVTRPKAISSKAASKSEQPTAQLSSSSSRFSGTWWQRNLTKIAGESHPISPVEAAILAVQGQGSTANLLPLAAWWAGSEPLPRHGF